MSIERAAWYAGALVSVLMLVVLGIPAAKYGKLNIALVVAMSMYLITYYTGVFLNAREGTWEYGQYFIFIGKLLVQMWVIVVLPCTSYFFMTASTALTIHWIFFLYILLEGSIRSRDETTPLVF